MNINNKKIRICGLYFAPLYPNVNVPKGHIPIPACLLPMALRRVLTAHIVRVGYCIHLYILVCKETPGFVQEISQPKNFWTRLRLLTCFYVYYVGSGTPYLRYFQLCGTVCTTYSHFLPLTPTFRAEKLKSWNVIAKVAEGCVWYVILGLLRCPQRVMYSIEYIYGTTWL